MNWSKAEELLARYYEGQTSAEEEATLKEMLSRTDVPMHLKDDAALFQKMKATGALTSSLSDQDLFAKLDEQIETPIAKKGKQVSVRFLLQIAAGFTLLLIGFGLGNMIRPEQTQSANQAAQLAEIRQEVSNMKQMLKENSPSERIKAASYVQDMDANAELIQTLIQTMHFDDNVNVRMAAIKALMNFRDQPEVRMAMIHTLKIQDDPNVQLQLIDGLVEMDEKDAVPQMKNMLKNPELQHIVKSRLQEGIGLLI